MPRVKAFLPALFILVSILACASPQELLPAQPVDQAATIVAGTLSALTPGAPLPTTTLVSAPGFTPPAPAALLPRSFYFMNTDSTGLLQVFRLERDGVTLHPVTFEPAAVDAYDVSPVDGAVVYVTNNQLLWADANGAGRRVLLDGGPLDDNNRFTNSIGSPVWSPDGGTIAFSRGGLNLYTAASGAVDKVLENQIDNSSGFPIVRELYFPMEYSPDGSKLLINISFFEAGTVGIYYPAGNVLVHLTNAGGGLVCCNANWIPDGTGLYAASPVTGLIESGLWYINAATGNVTTLLPGSPADGTFNFADAPAVGPDAKLHFFFNNLRDIPAGHTPLYMVRSESDGVTGRAQLRPDVFENINEILWAPDTSLAVVAYAPIQDVYQGGQAEVVYPDGRPNFVLTTYAYLMKWGP